MKHLQVAAAIATIAAAALAFYTYQKPQQATSVSTTGENSPVVQGSENVTINSN